MEIIAAAALIAVGIVFAALVYGRTHRAGGAGGQRASGNPEQTDRELAERSAALARREDAVARRDAALDDERRALEAQRQALERALEQSSGMSASQAKQALLQEIDGPLLSSTLILPGETVSTTLPGASSRTLTWKLLLPEALSLSVTLTVTV